MSAYRDPADHPPVEEKAPTMEKPFFCYFVLTYSKPSGKKGQPPDKDECYATFKLFALDKFEALNIAKEQIKSTWGTRFDSFQSFEVIGLEDFGRFTSRKFWSNVKLISIISFQKTNEIRVAVFNHTDKYEAIKTMNTVNNPEFVTKEFLENMIPDQLV
jgi:hypothetical protein